MSRTLFYIVRNEGPVGLYRGLSASLLRQFTYSTVRFGVYEEIKSRCTTTGGGQVSFPVLALIAAASGFLGGIAGNAADVLNVRMQHDAALPKHEQRNYKNCIDGLIRMTKDEGARSWFRGWLPNSSRAAVMTVGQLATYDTLKQLLVTHTPLGETLKTHFLASFLAGLAAATLTSPIDVFKTRVMSSTSQKGGIQLLADMYRTDGLRWMFKGWVPSFLRLGP
jgi:dicarboxylate transporter 10